MKRITRSIALFLAVFLSALVVAPRTALAIDHPITQSRPPSATAS